jgi:glycosyltransferase involved in cell wall biosynthesis
VAVTDSISCTLLQGQLGFFRQKGFEVTLLCAPGPIADRLVQREGATLVPVDMRRKAAPARDLIALLHICFALRRLRPDIVNTGTPKAGLLVMLGAWLCRVPCRVYTLRGLYLETSTGLGGMLLRGVERIACAMAHRVVCVSPSLRDRVLELGLVSHRKAAVLGRGSSNGIDLTRFAVTSTVRAQGGQIRAVARIDPGAVVIGFVGRLVRDKGVFELLEAWRILRREFTAAHLLIVGSFEDEDVRVRVHDLIESDSRVHVVGNVDDPATHYAAMDLVVLPTYREGLPNVLLEAGAMELPVVATRVTGCVDVVEDGVTGTLVPPRDAMALSEAIAAYLRDGDLRSRHGKAGRARVEREFAKEHVWGALCSEYMRLSHACGRSFDVGGDTGDTARSTGPVASATPRVLDQEVTS